jgi:hypothetical protein
MMIRKKHFLKRKPAKLKISEMVMGFAGDYIALGEDIEWKQENLNGAVSAWNIACLDEKDRERAIRKYMWEYRKLNPKHSKQNFRDAEDNLRLLIKQKAKLYPQVKVQIVSAHIQEIDGKNHVTVMSLSTK